MPEETWDRAFIEKVHYDDEKELTSVDIRFVDFGHLVTNVSYSRLLPVVKELADNYPRFFVYKTKLFGICPVSDLIF
jgi:hypothetical protein